MSKRIFPWREATLGLLVLVLLVSLYSAVKISSIEARLSGVQQEGLKDGRGAGQDLADDDPAKGDPDAPVTIVEFSDFQCPYCRKFYQETLPLIEERYISTGKVRMVYRDFPLGFHEYAQKAAEAGECADEQGKFWEYHDRLFQTDDLSVDNLKKIAADIGLDAQQFNSCLDSGKYASEVQKDVSDGRKLGVSGTPTFFINGKKIVGAQPFSVFEREIEQALQ